MRRSGVILGIGAPAALLTVLAQPVVRETADRFSPSMPVAAPASPMVLPGMRPASLALSPTRVAGIDKGIRGPVASEMQIPTGPMPAKPFRRFQREGGQAAGRHGGDVVAIKRVEHADEDGTRPHTGAFCLVRGAYFQDHVRLKRLLRAADGGAGGGRGWVGRRRMQAGARLHHDLVFGRQFFDCLRSCRYAGFARPCFGRNADSHAFLLVVSVVFTIYHVNMAFLAFLAGTSAGAMLCG